MRAAVITPAGGPSHSGNRRTAARWARLLGQLGHRSVVEEAWSGRDADVMLALHARRSHRSIRDYASARPERPLVVALTGTDLYGDIRCDPEAQESLELAVRLVVLQELALAELSPAARAKARVIYQSAEPVRREPPAKAGFDVCVVGNLRAEKDPFRTVLASRLLPASSRIRVTHVGRALDEGFAREARIHAAASPRYRWVGEVPHWRARRLMSRSRLLVQSSLLEGGANVVSEALAAELPVIASDIPGNVGVLGSDYRGLYPVGDEEALARLLEAAENDGDFYALLQSQCAARRHLCDPERERAALGKLIEEAVDARRGRSHRGRGDHRADRR